MLPTPFQRLPTSHDHGWEAMAMQSFLVHHYLYIILLVSITECMRPEHRQGEQTHHRYPAQQGTGGQASTNPNAPGPSTTQNVRQDRPLRVTTGRMRPFTGPKSPRFAKAYYDIRNSPGGRVLKGVSHTGILANPKSEFDYPKLSVTPGTKDSGVISIFHHPVSISGDGPHQYMQREKLGTSGDLSQNAQTYPLGLRKEVVGSEEDRYTRERLKSMSSNPYHPKSALSLIPRANSNSKQKRPKVDVDAGRYHGHLLTFVFGPESPPKHGGKPTESI